MTLSTYRNRNFLRLLIVILFHSYISEVKSQSIPKEEDYSRISTIVAPQNIVLEIGGMATLDNGNLAISTRRGDVYLIENPTSVQPYFRQFASGLHEVLGLTNINGILHCVQRGELTRLHDKDGNGKADFLQTVHAWPLSGHYHEYSYGPKVSPDGSLFVSANVAFGDEEGWRGESRVPWRGWVMKISPDGQMEPFATGMRSPCGLGFIDGELFYSDNQGDWVPSGGLVHLKKGSFAGHPAGLRWTELPGSPLKLTMQQHNARFDERRIKDEKGHFVQPQNIQSESFDIPADAQQAFPETQLPAVYLPHGILGISTSDFLVIPSHVMQPFGGQILVGDQGQSKINRVFMEKVNGVYQGAAWEFRSGFQSGVLRMSWAHDGSLFVGETNRGWGSAGDANQGLQRLVWNNKTPFEMLSIKSMPDGFEIEFTQPIEARSALDLTSFDIESFTYKYHPVYGSPTVNQARCQIRGAKLSQNRKTIRLVVDGLRKSYIHKISLEGIRNESSSPLLHPTAYYTLHQIQSGDALKNSELTVLATATGKKEDSRPAPTKTPAKSPVKKQDGKATQEKTAANTSAPTAEEVAPLLKKYTCTACHNADKRQVGPAFKEIARRKYTIDRMVQLIYNPEPKNWPGYATEMPPMPNVPQADARKIAQWINSLSN